MKRTALARGASTLSRSPMKRATKPMNQRSKKRRAVYAGAQGRAQFVADTLAARPRCEVRGPRCTLQAVDLHESITRKRGGAIVHGPLADAQGQRFYAICRACHDWTHTHRPWAELHGFLDARHSWQIPMEVAA